MVFLMTLLELIQNPRNSFEYLYIYRKYASIWNVPRRAIIIGQDITVTSKNWDQLNKKQMGLLHARYDCETIGSTLMEILQWNIPFSKVLVFN